LVVWFGVIGVSYLATLYSNRLQMQQEKHAANAVGVRLLENSFGA
jgi:hypothetical protein